MLRLIADGCSNDEISDQLYISKKTVEHHISAVYTKLGVTTRSEAIRIGYELRSTGALSS